MKKIFYILDPNGEFYSTDRTKRYKQLTGQALVLYLRSAETKKKYFEVWKMDKYTLLGVEVPAEKVKELAKEKRRRKYVNEVKKKWIDALKGSKYQSIVAMSLYTGLRPNELNTVKIEGDFVVARNSKRKGGKVEYKKIPITEMLRPYIQEFEADKIPGIQYIRDKFNAVLPNHIYYDLRTTFYTRCEECGVAEAARDYFVGHSRSRLNDTYSDLSDEYLLREGKKLVYSY